jgi:N-acetyl sugar amidotransferase
VPEKRPYQICTNCIMDTSDSKIRFDERGWCEYCVNFHKNIAPHWHPDEDSKREILAIADKIRDAGKGKTHDCIMGMSGGVDSSYLVHIAVKELGLRPLIFHVDAGWNSQQAVHNVERMVDGLGLDLHTEVIDWLEMQDLQLAYFKAQVPHVDTPQDHAFFGGMFSFASKYDIKYILTGANYSTECIKEPLEWHYHATDLRNLRDIHRQFGKRELKTFPLTNIFTYRIYYKYLKGIHIVKPLDYVPYEKDKAIETLVSMYGWQRYAHKHYESRFTRFYEGYWLPTKFGYDKRRAHFSSLILTNQMTREEALAKIAQPAYDLETVNQDFEYIATKLDISVDELRALHAGPNKSYKDYKNSMWAIDLGAKALQALGIEKRVVR